MTSPINSSAAGRAFRGGGLVAIALGLAACAVPPERDPIYQALKANPPKEIPARHLPRLRRDRASCDTFNKGHMDEYTTCWLPYGGSDPHVAMLKYFGPGLIRPDTDFWGMNGAASISGYVEIR